MSASAARSGRGSGNNLLARPGMALLEDLGRGIAAAAASFPVPSAHKRDLPHAVRDLSRLLTLERAELARSYWLAPRLLSAYLHYFLPWNLYRLAWLLPGLNLALRPGARLLDLGSGPLTLPLALWCARPDLRALPLSFTCCDVAARPMEMGRDILRRMAGEDSPWHIITRRAPLEKALARSGREEGRENFDCIMAGNVLNELSPARGTSLEERLKGLMEMISARLKPGGRLFLAEPGTRLGGGLIALARKAALAQGLFPLAPCTHDKPCPMLEPARFGLSYTGWCHFFHPAGEVYGPLAALARLARLEKDSLAISCLLLGKPAFCRNSADPGDSPHARSAGRFPVQNGKIGSSFAQGPRPSSGQRKDTRQAGFSDELDELETLYAEIMAQDSGQTPGPGLNQAGGRRPAPGRSGAALTSNSASNLDLRVVSDLIRLSSETEPGRYACCEHGLALLLDAARVPSGAFVRIPVPKKEKRDAKTGALLLRRACP